MSNKKKTNPTNTKPISSAMMEKEKREKAVNRYVFTCIGMIMYIMPCLSCLAIGIISEGGITPSFILAVVVELLSIPVGLMGINALKRPSLRPWCVRCAVVLLALHVICALRLLVWYLIMAPTFILLALFICWSKVVEV